MKPKLLIFDVDGTLFSSLGVILKVFEKTFARLKTKFPGVSILKSQIGRGLPEIFAEFLPAEKISEAVKIYREIYFDAQKNGLPNESIEILPTVAETLPKFAEDFSIAAFTMKTKVATDELFADFKIAHFFEIVVGFESVENSKPHPEGIFKCCEFCDAEISQTVFVGDSLHDFAAARAANCEFFAVCTGAASRADFENSGAENIFESLAEIAEFLKV